MNRLLCVALLTMATVFANGEALHTISIDGHFGDWAGVPSHFDPADNTHDTDHDQQFDVPAYVEHPDVDLLEYKVTHDEQNLYAYFRAAGVIGNTQSAAQGTPGRYYVILTIDVDQDDETGYWIHEGGYYPTSRGYDMNAEIEFYDGAFNTGHYLNHGCLSETEFYSAQEDQAQEFVDVRPGVYEWYTQWVMFLQPQGYPEEITLPSGRSIVWVKDKGPVYQGIVTIARSEDGTQAELKAPFVGFMNYLDGPPIMEPGRTLDISFSLEASGELAPGQQWASNTAEPINGYRLTPAHHIADTNLDGKINLAELSRLIQFYNLDGYHCQPGTEDDYAPRQGNRGCVPNSGDYLPQDWDINLAELLRLIQFYNSPGYVACDGSEDGYCPKPLGS